jgi:hypothetical protein
MFFLTENGEHWMLKPACRQHGTNPNTISGTFGCFNVLKFPKSYLCARF